MLHDGKMERQASSLELEEDNGTFKHFLGNGKQQREVIFSCIEQSDNLVLW